MPKITEILNGRMVAKFPLSEVVKLQAGDRITKAMMKKVAGGEFEYPVYGGGTTPTGYYSDSNFENSITIARAGSAGFVNFVKGKFWATDVCFVAKAKRERESTC